MSKHTAEYYTNYRKNNLEHLIEYRKKYYYSHRDKAITDAEEWKKANHEKSLVTRRTRSQLLRLEIIELLGGKCVSCGFNDWRALQVDHINGGGTKHRKTFSHSPSSLFEEIIKSIKLNEYKYQLLCANCNWIKRYEKGEHFYGK